jgi:hypothetical protein
MCLCEEARRSNLLVFAGFFSFNLLESFNYFTILVCSVKGIRSNLTDCFVVPPRKDTLILGFILVHNLLNLKLDCSFH